MRVATQHTYICIYLQGVPRNMTVVNSFERRLPYTVLDYIGFMQFISC